MRSVLFAGLFIAFPFLQAQTVVTVQNGPWTSPGTWDCGCVPDLSRNLVIMHSVEITASLLIGHQQVQVTSTGEITMSFPETVSFNTVFINEGHVLVIGEILNQGLFNNAGFAEFIGTLLNDGSIISDAGAVMQVEGDFVNQDLVQGEGAICVTDLTDNSGAISGTLDLCDWTPTVSSPPFIDQNSGAVENGITFCQNSPCASATGDEAMSRVTMMTDPAGGRVVLNGAPKGSVALILDATGRVVRAPIPVRSDRLEVDVTGLTAGVHELVVRSGEAQRTFPFVIAR